MHAVLCPQCKRVHQVSHPGPQARVRCRRCGTVFLAAPGPAQPPATGEDARPAQPARLHMYHQTRRKAGPWTAVVTLVSFGAAVALAIVLWSQYGKRRSTPGAASRPAMQQAHSRPVRSAAERGRQLVMGKIVRNDKDVGIDLKQIQGDVPGHWIVVATLHNRHEYALREVQVTISARRTGPGKEPLLTRNVACQYIPAGGSLGVSTEFVGVSAKDVRFTAAIDTAGVAPGTICLPIDPQDCQMARDRAKRRIVLTGELRNITGVALSDVRIFCDFYTQRGEWRGQAIGDLMSAQGLAPKAVAAFRAVLDGKQAAFLVENITDRPAIRLVARKQ